MPRRIVPLVAGECYHLYNRGHNRKPIFLEPGNYEFFLRCLRRYVTAKDAQIIAYALMPNHYHLLVETRTDDLSGAMQRFGISYTKAINRRFGRVGSIFQGAFQAIHVDRDEYLLHLSRYLHLNPVRARLVLCPQDWAFSSYREFVGLRHGTLPQTNTVLGFFTRGTTKTSEVSKTSEVWDEARQRYRRFVEAYHATDRAKVAHLLFGD